ncbi:MAG: VWA domain-containing protein [Vicinamibacterales bacterium]|jgi:uncharacterized membrane protein|nr:hypothetical protein [Acidobacteriota bacterium]MDP6372123.1 VWA domain-containing protein [Vicinamibacterales bacterium]|tara:strand:+ start:48 stop:2612 length:2565 start_codon:yes stop_codon:yes gene_type:complete
MQFSVAQYWPIVLVALVPLVWWTQRHSFTGFSARQRALQAVARSLVLLFLTFALMQPTWERAGRWLSVVYLLDQSASVSPASAATASQWIAAATREGRPDHWRALTFAGTTGALDDLEAIEAIGDRVDAPLPPATDAAWRTNLELAVREAARAFAPNHLKRLVLMTDGHETDGRLTEALGELQRQGIAVYTMPLDPRDLGDAWVDDVRMPEVATVDEPFPVIVRVHGQTDAPAIVDLLLGESVLDARSIQLGTGLQEVTLEASLDEIASTELVVRLRVAGDALPQNNRVRRSVDVVERPRVLYVEGHAESRQFLTDALEAGGLAVETLTPASLPEDADSLMPYAAVVFSDVAADALSTDQMEALATYVSDQGGGFVMAGGDAMYGEEGYADSALEALLPITFTVKERPEEFALIIVLDKSWSMVGEKIELSKEASKAAVDVLADHHQIGVVAFNNSLDWPVLLQRASNREWIKNKISTIMPSGHTNVYPALEEAFLGLEPVEGRLKHVILLSDGRTYPDDYEGLVTKMAEAGMTVSTVAMGQEADRELLANIADWGKGRGYVVEDAQEVPQIFAKETRRAAQPTLVEEPFSPIVRKQVEMFKGIDFASSPPLRGYVSTQLKDTSEALLISGEDDPILARWQFGLGRAVAFTSDVKNRWATEWLQWPGYGKFWTQLVRETMRGPDDLARALSVKREGDMARITLDLPPAAGPAEAPPTIRWTDGDGGEAAIETERVGPGSYVASVAIDAARDQAFSVELPDGAEAGRSLLASYPDEYRFRPADIELLQAVAADTGGVFAPSTETIAAVDGARTVRPVALWPYLAVAALALYLLDLLLRRIRLFDAAADFATPFQS